MEIEILKAKLLALLEVHFGDDSKRIDHALDVLQYAEQLLDEETGDPGIVIPAAILHDVGIKMAETRYGSSAGKYQEREGPPIARAMLTKLGLPAHAISEICQIIAHHHSPGIVKTNNFQLLYEADWLVNLGDEFGAQSHEKKQGIVDKNFKTKTGIRLAKEIYLLSGA